MMAKKLAKGVKKKFVPEKAAISKYHFAIGRRKTAQAKIKLFPDGKGEIKINNRDLIEYFPTAALQRFILEPLSILGLEKQFKVIVDARGGGVVAQAKAAGLGIARALLKLEPAHRAVLKKQGLLTRDARKKERKKPGLKRARRAPQWQKR